MDPVALVHKAGDGTFGWSVRDPMSGCPLRRKRGFASPQEAREDMRLYLESIGVTLPPQSDEDLKAMLEWCARPIPPNPVVD